MMEIPRLASAFIYYGEFFFGNRIDIYFKIDPQLAVIKCDDQLLRVLLLNALVTSLSNIRRGLRNDIKRKRITQEILIVARYETRANGVRLRFTESRLMEVIVKDTGDISQSLKTGGDDDYYNIGLGVYRDAVRQLGYSVSNEIGDRSDYTITSETQPFSPFRCSQKFTFPYKIHQESSKTAEDAFIKAFYRQARNANILNERVLYSEDWWTQRASHGEGDLVLRKNSKPLMLLIYIRPDELKKCIPIDSPYYFALNAFAEKNWRCEVIFVLDDSAVSRIREASCIVVDNCDYSDFKNISMPNSYELASKIRLLGYTMIMIVMDAIASRDEKLRSICQCDYYLAEPILKQDLQTIVDYCTTKLLSLMIREQLNDMKK
jgi:hypothetical protein